MLALLWLAYGAFGLAAGSIPPLVEPIINDLKMTSAQMGVVLGVWQLVFIGMAMPTGRLMDRFGERRTMAVGLALVLASVVLRGLAVNFVTLLGAVALFGVGGPIISIGIPKVTAFWFRGRERGVAVGIYVSGRDIGFAGALATAAGVVVALTGSWRGISLVYGVVLGLILVAWLLLARDAPRAAEDARSQDDDAGAPGVAGWGDLLRMRNVRIVLLLGFATFFVNHGLNGWLPTLLHENGMSLQSAGRWMSVAVMASMIGNMLLPSLAPHGYRALALTATQVAAGATTLTLVLLSGAPLIAMVMVNAVLRQPVLQMLTLVLTDTPGIGAKRLGLAAGLFFMVAEIGGFSGPLLLGLIRDATGSLNAGVLTAGIVIGVAALFAPLMREERR